MIGAPVVALLQAPIAPTAVRDTIAKIVLERGYQRSLSSTLLSRLWNWFWDLVMRLFRQATESRGTYIITLTLLGLVIAAAIVRAVIVARARRLAAGAQAVPETAAEKLSAARLLASQGAYVDAAHRLFAAVVTRLAEERRVRLHPSKTVGDYARDLRSAGDAILERYQAFARLYEVVAYGDGLCDAGRFARLEQLALAVLGDAAPAERAA